MNKTIKKKKSRKNKTQKKRVQRGGSVLHDNLKINIKSYIQASAEIASLKTQINEVNITKQSKKELTDKINNLKNNISNYEENIKKFIQNANSKYSSQEEQDVAKLYDEFFKIVQNNNTNFSIMNSILQTLNLIKNKNSLVDALQNLKNIIQNEPDQNSTDETLSQDAEFQKLINNRREEDLTKIYNDSGKRIQALRLIEEKKAAKEAARLKKKKEAEEAARLKDIADAEEAARLKAVADAEEADRLRAEQEAAEAARLKAEEEARLKEQESDAELKAITEAAKLKAIKDAEEAARLKAIKDAEEAARLKAIKDAEEAATKLKDAEEAATKLKDAEEAATKLKDAEEAATKLNDAKESARLKAEEEAREAARVKVEEEARLKAIKDAKEEADRLRAEKAAKQEAQATAVKAAGIKRTSPPSILDDNGLLPPIRHEKLKGLSNETKVLFSNRTFVYNLIEDNPINNAIKKKWLEIAIYLYTDYKTNKSMNQPVIDLTHPIIKKSFCYDPDDTSELDDLLTKIKLGNDTRWVENPNTVQVNEPSNTFVIQNAKPLVTYIHYKRIR